MSAWWMDQRRRERSGEVAEEKVTVFPESKRLVFDHWDRWCWSFMGCLVTDLRWLAGWTNLAKMWCSCVWRKSHQVLLELKQLQTPNFLLHAFKRWRTKSRNPGKFWHPDLFIHWWLNCQLFQLSDIFTLCFVVSNTSDVYGYQSKTSKTTNML